MTTRVYVELDALLDTRLATISKIDADAAVRMVKSEEYYVRKHDVFSGVGEEMYRLAWQDRNVDTLKRSMMTHVPLMLRELITKLEQDEEQTPFSTQLSIEVNTWPYQLSVEEQDTLLLAVMSYGGIQTIPEVVCKHPSELTPEKVKKTYSGLIMYNYRDWLELHLAELQKWPCPRVTLLAPALYHGPEPDMEELQRQGLQPNISGFEVIEISMAESIGLQLLDIKYFSILRSKYLHRQQEQEPA